MNVCHIDRVDVRSAEKCPFDGVVGGAGRFRAMPVCADGGLVRLHDADCVAAFEQCMLSWGGGDTAAVGFVEGACTS